MEEISTEEFTNGPGASEQENTADKEMFANITRMSQKGELLKLRTKARDQSCCVNNSGDILFRIPVTKSLVLQLVGVVGLGISIYFGFQYFGKGGGEAGCSNQANTD